MANGDAVIFGAIHVQGQTSYSFPCPACGFTRSSAPDTPCGCEKPARPSRRRSSSSAKGGGSPCPMT